MKNNRYLVCIAIAGLSLFIAGVGVASGDKYTLLGSIALMLLANIEIDSIKIDELTEEFEKELFKKERKK